MRKITQQAAEAFIYGRNRTIGNTHVHHDEEGSFMYLHGNLIARQWKATPSIVSVTLAGWPTPTTRERVNGLLTELRSKCGYYQKNHAQHFEAPNGDWIVDPSEWVQVGLYRGAECRLGT